MRIVFLSKTNPVRGGVERWLVDLALGLRQRGHEVVVGLARGARFHNPERYLEAHPQLREVSVLELDGRTGVYEGRIRAIENALANSKPDLVIPVMLHEVLYAAARRRSAGQSFKLLYPVHELGVWVFQAIQECACVIDGVAAVNRLILEHLRVQPGLSNLRLLHLPLGVEGPLVETRKKGYIGKLHLGYCGKLVVEQKRVFDLVDLCNSLDELEQPYRLSIAGSGPEEDSLRTLLDEQRQKDKVEFLGELSRQKLYEIFYSNIDVLMIMSEWETGPLVAWEAMLHDVAIVTSQYRGLRAEGVLKHGENCLIFPVGKTDEAARLIAEHVHRKHGLRAIAKTGRKLAEKQYTNDQMVDRWNEALVDMHHSPVCSSSVLHTLGKGWSITGYVEHIVRKSFNRPIYHSGPHDEWPRFAAGLVPRNENATFQDQLDMLEERNHH